MSEKKLVIKTIAVDQIFNTELIEKPLAHLLHPLIKECISRKFSTHLTVTKFGDFNDIQLTIKERLYRLRVSYFCKENAALCQQFALTSVEPLKRTGPPREIGETEVLHPSDAGAAVKLYKLVAPNIFPS